VTPMILRTATKAIARQIPAIADIISQRNGLLRENERLRVELRQAGNGRGTQIPAIDAVAERLRDYAQATIMTDIYEHDAMFAGGTMEQYLSVGRSAVHIIARAMIAAERASFGMVLDLPSGAGRVTRHLTAFLPDARLFAADLDHGSRDFACRTCGADPFETPIDFVEYPTCQFDLIFVGSLLTHFNAAMATRAVRWLIAALAGDGVLILTTCGRRHDYIEREVHHFIEPAAWERVASERSATGFGYVETEQRGGMSYGLSSSAPSWLMRLIENDPAVSIIGFQEAAWGGLQDVLVLQKKCVTGYF